MPRLQAMTAATLTLTMVAIVTAMSGEVEKKLPSFSLVQGTVVEILSSDSRRQPLDLLARGDVERVLEAVEESGWAVPDSSEILNDCLPDQHLLVTTFKTPAGQKFMRQIAGRELMYDRLERIAGVSGGPELIRDIVKLPDGARYAKPRSGGGIPDLLDLLPKKASGTTRRIAEYDRPTGHIYTAPQLLERLAASYQKAEAAQADPD